IHDALSARPAHRSFLFRFELFENAGEERRLFLVHEVLDAARGKLKLSQDLGDLGPESVALLPLGEVQVGDQVGESLNLDRIEILIISLDDLLLIGRMVGHDNSLFRGRGSWARSTRSIDAWFLPKLFGAGTLLLIFQTAQLGSV